MAAARRPRRELRGRRRRGADAAGPRLGRGGRGALRLRVTTANLASGRRADGSVADEAALRAALSPLADAAPDVLAVQEVDVASERSHGVHQARVVAEVLASAAPRGGAGQDGDAGVDWRFAPTLVGTPGPGRDWEPVAGQLEDRSWPQDQRPRYGVALLVRRPVRRWRALPLRAGQGRLPLPVRDPGSGRRGLLVVPDEPRVAVAAELDGLTVVATHLSFSPPTALRQLRAVRAWTASMPGPVVLLGDLNLPGSVPSRVLRARALAAGATYPQPGPRLQLDHVLALPPLGDRRGAVLMPWRAADADLEVLGVGDHRSLCVDLEVPTHV